MWSVGSYRFSLLVAKSYMAYLKIAVKTDNPGFLYQKDSLWHVQENHLEFFKCFFYYYVAYLFILQKYGILKLSWGPPWERLVVGWCVAAYVKNKQADKKKRNKQTHISHRPSGIGQDVMFNNGISPEFYNRCIPRWYP